MKRKIYMFLGLFVSLAIISIVFNEISNGIKNHNKNNKSTTTETVASYGDATSGDADRGYSYTEVESVVSYLADSEDKANKLSRLIDPLTQSNTINVAYVKNVVSIIGASEDTYSDILSGKDSSSYVSTDEFDEIYNRLVDSGIVKGLVRKDILVLDANVSDDGLYMLVDDGYDEYAFDKLYKEEYRNRIIDAYVKDSIVFKINGYSEAEKVLNNAWIISASDGNIEFLYHNIRASYKTDESLGTVRAKCVATITLTNRGISSIDTSYKTVEDQVVAVGESLQLKNGMPYTIGDNFAIYNVDGDVSYSDSLELLKGYVKLKLLVKGNVAHAAIIDGPPESLDIKVILSNSQYTSYDMDKVTLSSEGKLKVTYPDDSEKIIAKGEKLTFKFDDFKKRERVTVEPLNSKHGIKVETIERECGNPIYFGSINVMFKGDYINLINVVPLEEYLYGVVSSEIPSSFEREAQAAMAICARAYVCRKLKDKGFMEYGANLDDSDFCQVYNNVLKTEESVRAVNDTYGIVPVYKGKVVYPLYFSTSCGSTCINDEIWGGKPYKYLNTNLENIDKTVVDLSDEETFKQFIKNSLGYDMIEKDMPYYRWSVSYTKKEMSAAINANLKSRIEVAPDNIKVKVGEDKYEKATDIESLGTITDIRVAERSKSGMILAMEIEGTKNTISVKGQTNIRNLISPEKQEIIRQDKNSVTGWTSLPSTFYYVDKEKGKFTIYGGGFGHGAGLSQNGANELAKMGYGYKYIIRHYYSCVDFEVIYEVKEKEEDK